MTFGKRLTELRKEQGFTREAFADYLSVSEQTLGRYERDEREPNFDFIKNISQIFDVSTDYLLCVTDEKERKHPYRLKPSEFEFISKYRELDGHGKEVVDFIFEREYLRQYPKKKGD